MKFRCDLHLNGGSRKLILMPGPNETVEHLALKLAAKVMQEPSEGMCMAVQGRLPVKFSEYASCFTAMISQACAEITTQKDSK